ncbi:MAG: YeeE/YedE family protein [Burkholderiaceae bacterium]
METEFTPWLSAGGGLLIGLAAVILMAANGRVAGVSGIVARLLPPTANRSGWLAGAGFVAGLLLAMPLSQWLALPISAQLAGSGLSPDFLLLVGAGLLVGFGSVLGSGCTSGHGVCGISHLSLRSILATGTFMVTGFLSVYLLRHVLGG